MLFAARQGDLASARMLLAAGAGPNDTAPSGTSALVVAAHSGHGALAAWLLEQGADPNAAGAGYTPLHAAILRGDADLVSALLAHGADPNARLKNGSPHARYGKFFALEMRLDRRHAVLSRSQVRAWPRSCGGWPQPAPTRWPVTPAA